MSAKKDPEHMDIILVGRQIETKALIGTTQHTLIAEESSAKELIKTPKLKHSNGNLLGSPPSQGALYSIKLCFAAHHSSSGLPLHSSKRHDQEPQALTGKNPVTV